MFIININNNNKLISKPNTSLILFLSVSIYLNIFIAAHVHTYTIDRSDRSNPNKRTGSQSHTIDKDIMQSSTRLSQTEKGQYKSLPEVVKVRDLIVK